MMEEIKKQDEENDEDFWGYVGQGIGWFFIFLGAAIILFIIGWCGEGFPGLK